MKKELNDKINKKIEHTKRTLMDLEIDSFPFRIAFIKQENLIELQDYASFLYDSGLLLTDINGYRKENNTRDETTDEELRQEFAIANAQKQQEYNAIVLSNHSRFYQDVYRIMGNEQDYFRLKQIQEELLRLLAERDNIHTTISFDQNIPIKGLEILNKSSINLSINELKNLKERVEQTIKKLPLLQEGLINYSPEFLDQVLCESYKNTIERLKALFTLFKLHPADPLYDSYFWIEQEFNMLRKEYHRLRFKSLFSADAREERKIILDEINILYNEVVNILTSSINNGNSIILSNFIGDFTKLSTKEQLALIDNYIIVLKQLLEKICRALSDTLEERKAKNGKMQNYLVQIKKELGLTIQDPEDFASKDLFDIYKEVDRVETLRYIDNSATLEIVQSYGRVADEHLYRIVPINK